MHGIRNFTFFVCNFSKTICVYCWLMGLDRYIRIKYKVAFNSIITPIRAYFFMTAVSMLAVVIGIMTVPGIYIDKRQLIRGIVTSIDSMLFICTVSLQIRTISILKATVESAHSPTLLQSTRNKIIKLTLRVMKMFVMLLFPFLVVSFMHSRYERKLHGSSRSYMSFAFRFSFLGSYLNGFGNALMFLTSNTQVKQYLKRKFLCLGSNQIITQNCVRSKKSEDKGSEINLQKYRRSLSDKRNMHLDLYEHIESQQHHQDFIENNFMISNQNKERETSEGKGLPDYRS